MCNKNISSFKRNVADSSVIIYCALGFPTRIYWHKKAATSLKMRFT